jgi:hypothetical protein
MIKKIFGIIIFLVAFFSFALSELPEELKKEKKRLDKTTTNNQWRKIATNNLEMWFSNVGYGSQDPVTGNNGLMFPTGSGMGVIYIDGAILSGTVGGTVKLQGSAYNTSLQAGPSFQGVDPADPRYRVYLLRKGLETEEQDVFLTGPNYTKDNFQRDYNEWPIDMGAPYEIVNGNRVPKMIGDEQAWFVMNDYSPNAASFYTTTPCGTEWQALIWAYNASGALGNVIFKKYIIINKGNDPIENAYLSYWSDPDLGDAGDDLVGCDTILKMGYTYNGGAKDAIYGQGCPAAGYTYLQGPTVLSDNPNDEANWNFGKKYGYKNLPMTSFTFFANSNSGLPADYTDPSQTSYAGSVEFYELIKGNKKNGQPWTDEKTGQDIKFLYPGDPTTRSGWIDGGNPTGFAPRDVRMTISSGPFTLAVGDTQELVIGIVIGQGPDRLSSISVMKFYNLQVQKAYDDNFDLASAPSQPVVSVGELPNLISLSWGNPDLYPRTENFDEKGYKFGGYIVYQLPKASSTKADAKRIATFDLEDGYMMIFDKDVDPNSGAVVSLPVIIGNDGGIRREILIDHDYIRDRALVNGQTYYFAVTSFAYNVDPDIVPLVLENRLQVIPAIPQYPKNGYSHSSKYGDYLEVASIGTISSAKMYLKVVDPTRVNGHDYEITFDTVGHVAWDDYYEEEYWETETYWKLTDKTLGKELTRSFNQEEESEDYPVVDGLFIKITGPLVGGVIHDHYGGALPTPAAWEEWLRTEMGWDWSPRSYENINYVIGSSSNYGQPRFINAITGLNYGLEAFGNIWNGRYNSLGYAANSGLVSSTVDQNQLPNVEIRFNSDESKWQKGYRYLRFAQNAAADPSFEPFIINKTNYAYQDYVPVPFTVWDVESTPERQLNVGFLENNESPATGVGSVDGRWRPTTASLGGREFLFIFNSNYSDFSQPQYQVVLLDAEIDALYFLASMAGTARFPNDSGSNVNATFKIKSLKPNLPTTKFSFKSPVPPSYAEEKAKFDVKNITVFPNPYYGKQVFETNKFNKFVTFSRLPKKATIKIYTLAGEFVRTIEKNDETQFITWDLKNHNFLSVASGMYIAHIDMPEIGETKILKIAIIMEQQLLDKI